jgi:ERCC4-type nuclease
MSCHITIDSNEGEFLSHILKHDEKKRLPVGDILLECGDTNWIFERKTWGDGLSSWKSKRLQDQISRMIESHDNYAVIVEGKPEDYYAPSPDDWGHFRAFLNRVSVEVCPVIYTDTITETARYINAFKLRLEDDSQGHFVRPVTSVKSSRNKHHNLLQTIPGIGREKAKALYDHYPTLKSLISNWDDAQSNKIVVGKTWIKVEAFLNKKWGNTPTKPEVIRERKKSESIQRTFDWWEVI